MKLGNTPSLQERRPGAVALSVWANNVPLGCSKSQPRRVRYATPALDGDVAHRAKANGEELFAALRRVPRLESEACGVPLCWTGTMVDNEQDEARQAEEDALCDVLRAADDVLRCVPAPSSLPVSLLLPALNSTCLLSGVPLAGPKHSCRRR